MRMMLLYFTDSKMDFFTFIISEIRIHIIIDVVSKINWQCVPCWFFCPPSLVT